MSDPLELELQLVVSQHVSVWGKHEELITAARFLKLLPSNECAVVGFHRVSQLQMAERIIFDTSSQMRDYFVLEPEGGCWRR